MEMKEELIQKCPNMLFPKLANAYYLVKAKEKVKIRKASNGWLIQKDGLELLSPTPKFLGFGMTTFKHTFERFFKIERGDTAVDIGACIGDTTLPMLLKVGTFGKVIAVEPDPLNVNYLKLNLAGYDNLEIIQKALWNERTTLKFHMHNTPTGHSIIASPERERTIDVQADTFDNVLGSERIDFAKIDVQGAEAQVLQGGEHCLKKIRKLIVETHCKFSVNRTYPKVLKILRNYDFEIRFTMDNSVVYAWR